MSIKKNNKEQMGLGIRALLKGIESDMQTPVEKVSSSELDALSATNLVPIDQIEINPFQPRTDFDLVALQELANSIKIHGIIQPLTLRKLAPNQYQLIAGERRFRASKIVGLKEVPAYVRSANDQEMLEIALIENIQREDLNSIEVAITYKRLIDECDLTHENLSDRLGKERSTITNFLRLLKLSPEIQSAIKSKSISMGHARALAGVENPITQISIFKQILSQSLSVRKTEELCRTSQNKPAKTKSAAGSSASPMNNDLKRIQHNISSHLSTKVEIQVKKDEKGEIKIQFFSLDDLQRILDIIEQE